MRWIMRCIPKWMAPRLALAILLTMLGVAGLLLIPPLFDNGNKRVGTYVVEAPASHCPVGMNDAAVRCEVNAFRAANQLPPLRKNVRLTHAAKGWAQTMVREHFFAHSAPGKPPLTGRARAAGYRRFRALGENIAWGMGTSASPSAIVAGWMQSPPHRAVMLTPSFREAGVGITHQPPQGGDGATYVLDVGRSAS
jgi:uncharacterized protein YkwD